MNAELGILDHPAGDPRKDLALELRLMEEAVAGGPGLLIMAGVEDHSHAGMVSLEGRAP